MDLFLMIFSKCDHQICNIFKTYFSSSIYVIFRIIDLVFKQSTPGSVVPLQYFTKNKLKHLLKLDSLIQASEHFYFCK